MAFTPLQLWLLGLMAAVKLLAASSVAFLPVSSRCREFAAAVILGLYFLFYRDTQLLKVEALKISLNTFSVIQVGNIVDVLCISRTTYPNVPQAKAQQNDGQVRRETASVKSGIGQRFSWGLATVWNFRGVGTPQEVKGIPHFWRRDPSYVPEKAAFLARRCLGIAVRIVILKAWGPAWPLLSPSVDLAFGKQYLFSRIGAVSSHEMLIRVWATYFAIFDVCRLSRGTLLARYSRTFLVFWISGMYHILSDGVEVESGVVRFFVMQAAAIMLEDAVQALYQTSRVTLGVRSQKLIGYIWVYSFLVWTSPGWRYPVIVYRFRDETLGSRM
ncbi:hypothetical protein THAR02_11197 [Trichoderma harzianum]|uniref:Wax synthase domain-containing protein n=1 Tax=Trichoderma harzianum TaxID=5544 RepID=A0A0F9Z7V6_TRIHA|nr:hypothetical protein THAR02_11197 [Trichoderma harzianum]